MARRPKTGTIAVWHYIGRYHLGSSIVPERIGGTQENHNRRATQRRALAIILVYYYTINREGMIHCQPRAIRCAPRIATTSHLHPKAYQVTSTAAFSQVYQASLSMQPTPLQESMGRSNQRRLYGLLSSSACFRAPLPLPLPTWR